MYRILCNLLLIAAAACVLAAVWLPGEWWRWAMTGVIALFVAAYCGGVADDREGE